MQNDPLNHEAPVRHRRSSRHEGARGAALPGQASAQGRPALPERDASAPRRCAAPLPRRRTAAERLPLSRVLILAALVLVCILGAYRLAENSLRITELREARAAEEAERQALILRHRPLYTDLIEHWAGRNGIEPAYVCAIIYRESHYDPTAVSSAGARGLMQLMPDTGTWWAGNLGLTDYTADSLFTPEVNIRLGVRYLRYLSEKFDGDPILVACGFHAGAGNVESWLGKYSSDGKTLTLDEIPMDDTKTYARRVMESYAIYLQYYYPSGGRA